MQRALVTGGCGFLGSWIVKQLLEDGVKVRVLAVKGERRDNVAGLDVEIVEGDVRDVETCKKIVDGMDTVFHAAAIYTDWAPDPTLMYEVNSRGTFHVLEASRRAGVEKVIYTASIVSIGRPAPGYVSNEKTPYECWDLDFPYSRSKFHSRELAECFAAWDLDVRVVCPGIVFGPGDIRPTPSGQLIVSSFMPGPALHYPGGASYVDVRDAARVHLLAAEHGKKGERYLATAHNLTNEEFVDAIDRASGRKRPKLGLPVSVARGVAVAMGLQSKRSGKPPMLSRDFFEYSLKPSYYSNVKAVRDLGARFRPIDETITDAIAYFRERGLIQ
ncbi:MAG: NAD-dependent epimerase/dehydratase family protein [Sandaracinaceae bacterium]|nr:NAD-dependent epimerase/dehydratase family protein [Sandaracinaceae bacterium]